MSLRLFSLFRGSIYQHFRNIVKPIVQKNWTQSQLISFESLVVNYHNTKISFDKISSRPSKGQLISKCPFRTNEIFVRFSALVFKKRLNQEEINALYFFIIQKLLNYRLFLIWPLFRGKDRNPYKNFIDFLVDLKTPK